jgi:disintegrin and metalloproteinase domain-containing protein 10
VREKHHLHRHRKKIKDKANNNNSSNRNNNNNNNNNSTPKKVLKKNKKKKKVTTPVTGDDMTAVKQSGEMADEAALEMKSKKMQQQTKGKKKKKKEVIDYSAVQSDKDKVGVMLGLSSKGPLPDSDPVGKVKNWLLNSQPPVDSILLPKSKSTPIGLTGASGSPARTRAPAVTHHNRSEKHKSQSTGNLQGAHKNGGEKEKLRLQVVYKPPFKFSLKLHKAEKGSGASTSVIIVDKSHQRSAAGDRKRGGVGGSRAAMLLRSRDRKRITSNRKPRAKESVAAVEAPVCPAVTAAPMLQPPLPPATGNQSKEHEADIDSNIHTVPSDLEVLLSESEFLFSDA